VCNMRSCGAPRDGGFAPMGPSAAPKGLGKGGGKAAAGEAWVCDKCGNSNFEGRIYCNMRTCGNPGPWVCPACGNKNFAGRKVCNMKKCNHPMPPPPPGAGPLATIGSVAGFGPHRPEGAQAAQAAQALALLQASGLSDIPGVAEGIQKIQEASGVTAPVAGPANKGGGNEIKEGSWVCVECGNINFPTRDVCNGKMCGRPREVVDGGPPAQGTDSKTRLKPGSWVCSACNNVNWPERDSCGMRKCGRPRIEVDAGPPMGL